VSLSVAMDITIASYNVNGLLDQVKRNAVFHILETINAQTILLQETHSSILNQHIWQNEWSLGQSLFRSSTKDSNTSGVATLLKSKHLYMERIANDLNGRILTVKVFSNNHSFHITNIYAPSGKRNRTQNHYFFENLYPYIYSKNPLILAGDFNCIENPILDKHPPAKTYPKPQTLITLNTNLNLHDTYRTLHPTQTTYTHHAPNSQSRLDRFYVNRTSIIQNHVFIPTLFSDHNLIALSL